MSIVHATSLSVRGLRDASRGHRSPRAAAAVVVLLVAMLTLLGFTPTAHADTADAGGATKGTATALPIAIPGSFVADNESRTSARNVEGYWNNLSFWTYTPETTMTVTIRAVSISPARWDNTLEVWEESGESYSLLAQRDDAYGLDAMVTVPMTEGHKYIIGMGGWSTGSRGTATLYFGNQPPDVPTDVAATPDDGKVSLTWTAPSDNSAAITKYTVYTFLDGEPVGSPVTVSGSPPSTAAIVSGLTNGAEYTFQVTATNANGESDASDAVSAKPVGKPGAPTEVTAAAGDGAVTVSWTAPSSDGASAITSYTVVVSPGDVTTTTADGAARTAVVRGLTNGESYTATVFATNAIGDGPESDASNSVTPVRPQPPAPRPESTTPTPAPTATTQPSSTTRPTPPASTTSTSIPTNNLKNPETFASNQAPAPQPLPGESSVNDTSASQFDVDTHTPTQGGDLTLVARGFKPGSVVDFWMHSIPVYLGSAIADIHGIAVLPVKLDATVVGAHHVQSIGIGLLGEPRNLAQPIRITAPALASTGFATLPITAVALLLIAAGVALVKIQPHRRRPERSTSHR